jgi:hypothetical protein
MTTILRRLPALEPAATDPHSTTWDVSDSLTIAVDASTTDTREALRRLDLTAPAKRALHALAAADRVALLPARVGASPTGLPVLGLIWQLEGSRPPERLEPHAFEAFSSPGHVKVRWEILVEPAAEAGAFLSITTRVAATDDRSRARLLDAWGIVGHGHEQAALVLTPPAVLALACGYSARSRSRSRCL